MGACLAKLCPTVEITEDPASGKASISIVRRQKPTESPVEDTGCILGGPTSDEDSPRSSKRQSRKKEEQDATAEDGPKAPLRRNDSVNEQLPNVLSPREAAARAAEARAAAYHAEQAGENLGKKLDPQKRQTGAQALQQATYDERRGREVDEMTDARIGI